MAQDLLDAYTDKPKLGPNTEGWIAKIANKATQGLLDISLDLVSKALGKYLGF